MTKRYYWLKLKNDFFNQKEIKMLRKLAGGDTYTIIYLKMLLISLENEGKIYYDGVADNMIEEIALDIDEDVENVQVTFSYLIKKGLIIDGKEEDVEMMKIGEMIGSESASAMRVRRHRRKKALQSNNDVTQEKRLGNTEKEIDIELEKEIDIELGMTSGIPTVDQMDTQVRLGKDRLGKDKKDIDTELNNKTLSSSDELDSIPYKSIIDYLNETAGRNYKHSTSKTKNLIKTRWEEGFSQDDFKKVIDTKVAEWENTDMSKYIRPETLFGTKFESYLNQQHYTPTKTDERYKDLPI